jgi:hypothetical protein
LTAAFFNVETSACLFFPALFTVAADFGSCRGDLDAAVFFDLLFQFFVEVRLEFTDGSAFQAGHVDMVARAVALIEVLAAAQMKQVELVDQAVAFQQIEGAVDGDSVDARVEFLRSIEDGARVEMALGVVHDLENHFPLARQAHASLGEGFLQAARTVVGVNAFAGGNPMCCGGHDSVGEPAFILDRASGAKAHIFKATDSRG